MVDVDQVRQSRSTLDARLQQGVLTLCGAVFVVLFVVGAPLWIWAAAVIGGLIVVSLTDVVVRRRRNARRSAIS